MPRRSPSSSLRAKIVLILSAVVLAYAGLDYAIQRIVVFDSFVELEEQAAAKDVQRVVDAIQNEIRHLDVRCDDWAAWDDTFHFVDDANAAYKASNLGDETFAKNDFDLLYICAAPRKGQHRVVWGRILDPATGEDISLRDFPRETLGPWQPLVAAQWAEELNPGLNVSTSGLLMTEHGPMLVSAKPILDSRRRGPPRGTVLMGRFLGAKRVESLCEQTGVEFHAWPVEGTDMPAEEAQLLEEVTSATAAVIRGADEECLRAYSTFPDIRAAPALLIRAEVPRGITARGTSATRYALFSTIAAGLLIMLVLLMLLQRTVLAPIAALTAQAVELGRSEDFSRKLNLARADEIGILSREFDAMMEKLAKSRADLVTVARAAGMSEIATGVLHNVGNVLNSVNVSATLVADKARNSPVNDLQLAMAAVRDSVGDLATFLAQDPRGPHLFPLLCSLADDLGKEQQTIVGEVANLTEGIEHIKELIQAQQSYAGRSGVRETLALADLVESALHMTSPAVDGVADIEVVREFEALPALPVDRHRLMEILVNLIQNARQAMQAPTVSARRLTLRLKAVEHDHVRIEVSDTGVGIEPANLTRVFNHGFTTKATGHGFGLHASANAATEMHGRLTAQSDGPGRGATFALEFPIRAAQALEVAVA